MELTPEVVFALVQSDDPFPVDFDHAWRWIGYKRKDYAKDVLTGGRFTKGIDYVIEFSGDNRKTSSGGRPREIIRLTVDCFKSFCMKAETEKGDDVRLYFIACEQELKRRSANERSQTQDDYRKKLHDATLKVYLLDDPVKWSSRGRIFQESFYKEVYRLKGHEFTPGRAQHPLWMAHITIDVVYSRLQPGVWDELTKKNPRLNGRRKHCCHQFLSDNIGNPHLRGHLYAVTKMMSRCSNWKQFVAYLDKFHPKCTDIQLDVLFDLLAQTPEEFERWNGLVS